MKLDKAVTEVPSKLVSNKKFAGLIRSKIDIEVDTTSLDQEIVALENRLSKVYGEDEEIERYNVYHSSLLIRHANDGRRECHS